MIKISGNGSSGNVSLSGVTFTDVAPSNTDKSSLSIVVLNKVGRSNFSEVTSSGCKARLVKAVESNVWTNKLTLKTHTFFGNEGGVFYL